MVKKDFDNEREWRIYMIGEIKELRIEMKTLANLIGKTRETNNLFYGKVAGVVAAVNFIFLAALNFFKG